MPATLRRPSGRVHQPAALLGPPPKGRAPEAGGNQGSPLGPPLGVGGDGGRAVGGILATFGNDRLALLRHPLSCLHTVRPSDRTVFALPNRGGNSSQGLKLTRLLLALHLDGADPVL